MKLFFLLFHILVWKPMRGLSFNQKNQRTKILVQNCYTFFSIFYIFDPLCTNSKMGGRANCVNHFMRVSSSWNHHIDLMRQNELSPTDNDASIEPTHTGSTTICKKKSSEEIGSNGNKNHCAKEQLMLPDRTNQYWWILLHIDLRS